MSHPRLSLRLAMGAVALAAVLACVLLRPWPQPPPSQKEAIALARAAVRYDGDGRTHAEPDGRGGWVVSFPGTGILAGWRDRSRPPKPLIVVPPVPTVHVRFDRRCERYEDYNPEHHPPPPPPAVTVERSWLERLRDRLP